MTGPVYIVESPPAVQHAKGQVVPAASLHILQGHHLTGRGEQFPAVGQGFPEVAGGVENVGRDHEVVAVRFEALGSWVFLDIQRAEIHRGAELCDTRRQPRRSKAARA